MGTKVVTRNIRVSCAFGIVGTKHTSGLEKIGFREKIWTLGKRMSLTTLWLKEKIILPPLHIKLGLMKQFVKALDKNGSFFAYLGVKMHQLSTEKLKAGIFDGPQII